MIEISDNEDEFSYLGPLGLSDCTGSLLAYLRLNLHQFVQSISSLEDSFKSLLSKYQSILRQMEREYYCVHDQSVDFHRKEVEHDREIWQAWIRIVTMQQERRSLARQIVRLEEQVATSIKLVVAL